VSARVPVEDAGRRGTPGIDDPAHAICQPATPPAHGARTPEATPVPVFTAVQQTRCDTSGSAHERVLNGDADYHMLRASRVVQDFPHVAWSDDDELPAGKRRRQYRPRSGEAFPGPWLSLRRSLAGDGLPRTRT
jgi:hypothetical protein